MGRLCMCKCSCGYEEDFHIGAGFMYEEVGKRLLNESLYGKHGALWRDILKENPSYIVDVDRSMFQCPNCDNLTNEYNLDIYDSTIVKKHICLKKDEILYEYKHICNKCQKRMVKIFWYRNENESIKIKCPKCHSETDLFLSGFWD